MFRFFFAARNQVSDSCISVLMSNESHVEGMGNRGLKNLYKQQCTGVLQNNCSDIQKKIAVFSKTSSVNYIFLKIFGYKHFLYSGILGEATFGKTTSTSKKMMSQKQARRSIKHLIFLIFLINIGFYVKKIIVKKIIVTAVFQGILINFSNWLFSRTPLGE